MSQKLIARGAAGLYKVTYSGFIKKIFSSEEINAEVFSLVEKGSGEATK